MDKTKTLIIASAIIVTLILIGSVYFLSRQKTTSNPSSAVPANEENNSDTQETEINTEETNEQNEDTNANNKVYTMAEVAQHSSKSDCWMIIHDKVYDVTSFIEKHPGGDSILQGCGKDATELFETRPMGSGTPHSDKAKENLENFYIGDLQK
ncbi:MAG: hypothetical protein KatS3mg090_0468 [Patescibacteria group bacterium]|nr:MAG: hypothetical protein KatS3mg090_0468 [Patescibacteria group bacterium]